MNDTVSLIIPVYNGEKYIQRCLDRLKKEKYPHLEIIVVNDGSTDNTEKILQSLKDNKIRIISKENGGVSSARNAALDIASGDMIMFLDCDDILQENAIEKAVLLMNEHNADIVRFRLCYFYPDGTEHIGKADYTETTAIFQNDFYSHVYRHMMCGVRFNHIVRTLYRRSCIENLRFRTDLHTAEDLCFNISAFSNAKKYIYTPDINYYYYCSGTGLTGNGLKFGEKLKCNIKAADEIKKSLAGWGCDTLSNRIRADLRIWYIISAKIKRMIFGGDAY